MGGERSWGGLQGKKRKTASLDTEGRMGRDRKGTYLEVWESFLFNCEDDFVGANDT